MAETGVGGTLADQPIDVFVDGLHEQFVRQVTEDPSSVVLDVEFWLAAARDTKIRKKIVSRAEDQRRRTGEVIDRQLARAGRKSPFTGRELGIIGHALAGGLAVEHHLEPDAVDPELFGRALRVLFGLEPTQASSRPRPAKASRTKRSR
jgi:hypothetical protein